jgi:hypothetical protein
MLSYGNHFIPPISLSSAVISFACEGLEGDLQYPFGTLPEDQLFLSPVVYWSAAVHDDNN